MLYSLQIILKVLRKVVTIIGALFLLALVFMLVEYYNDPSTKVVPQNAYKDWEKLHLDDTLFKTGDIILRDSKGFFSQCFKDFSLTDKAYSHSGVIIKDTLSGKFYVYHCVGGEDNITNYMKKDRLEVFVSPKSNYKFGVYRYAISPTELKAFTTGILQHYQNKMDFDLDMDIGTDEKMYCSEIIYKTLRITSKKDYIAITHAFGKQYVALDNLYLNEITKQIIKINYEKNN